MMENRVHLSQAGRQAGRQDKSALFCDPSFISIPFYKAVSRFCAKRLLLCFSETLRVM